MRGIEVGAYHFVALIGRVVNYVAAHVSSVLEATSWLRLVALACSIALSGFASTWSVCVEVRNRELLDRFNFAELALSDGASVFLRGAGDIFIAVLLRGH